MSFIIEKRIKDSIYLYEATSWWDPEQKKTRQTRRYLGKKDPRSGKVIPPRRGRQPRQAKDYGNIYLLQQLAERTGLTALLHEVFWDDAPTLVALACFDILEAAPLYLFAPWVETTAVESVKALSSEELSPFTHRLGQMDAARETFFHHWISRCGDVKTIVFDITSLSSYSTQIAEVEWGYNRDHDPLPQINLGIVYAEQEQLPLYYQVYPGSIRDVSTLPNIVRYLEGFAVAPDLFVMDRGFYSAKNLATMAHHAFTFLIPLPRSVKVFSSLLTQHRQTVTALPQSILFQQTALGYLQTRTMVQKLPVSAHVFYDPIQQTEQTQRFLTRLWTAEATASPHPGQSPQQARQALTTAMKGAATYFVCRKTKGGTSMKRRTQRIAEHLAPMGVTIFLTTHADLEPTQLLTLYRQKDFLEKTFDTLKHDCDGRRLRGYSTDAIMGRIFVKFLSLILYSAVTNSMRSQPVLARYSVREVFCELKKLRLVEMQNGTKVLTEISRRQKDIFKAFQVPPPTIKPDDQNP